MKIHSDLKNNKTDNSKKRAAMLAANHRLVRHDGNVYQITVATIGREVLASAELLKGNSPIINLFDKTKLATELKKLVENNLFS